MSDSSFAGLDIGNVEEGGFDQQRLNRIGTVMENAVAAGKLPGAVTVVARHGRIIHAHVVGSLDIEKQDNQLGMDSLFRMYSQTKPVTAVVAMTMFEEGLFRLDDPISKWLPEFAEPRVVAYRQPEDRYNGMPLEIESSVVANREITIFDLMTMTSGLPAIGRTPANYWQTIDTALAGTGFLPWDERINDPGSSYEDMFLALAGAPLYAQPGEVFNYGLDFDVLSILLTRASDQSLDELFRQRVFEPLGMKDSGFYCERPDVTRLATDHGWDLSGNLVVRDPAATAEKTRDPERKLMSGNGLFGGVLSTPIDYARFSQMLLNGGALDGVRILGRKTIELMTTNHIGDRSVDISVGPGYGFGLGYAVRKQIEGTYTPGSIGSFGWGGAAGTQFFVDPVEDMWGLFFTHVFGYEFAPGADLMDRFEKQVYEALS